MLSELKYNRVNKNQKQKKSRVSYLFRNSSVVWLPKKDNIIHFSGIIFRHDFVKMLK